jgi:hypothetical protein
VKVSLCQKYELPLLYVVMKCVSPLGRASLVSLRVKPINWADLSSS